LYHGNLQRGVELSGTKESLVVPGSRFVQDVGKSFREVQNILRRLHKQHNDVIVVGESLGAFFAAPLSERLRRSDKLILLNPMLKTPAAQWVDAPIREAMVPSDEASSVAMDNFDHAHRLQEASRQLMESYFGPYVDSSVISLIDVRTPAAVTLIYGGNDPVVSRKDVDAIAGLPFHNFQLVRFDENGHEYIRGAKQAAAVESAIWRN
jgi:pimeloyl-ACP methyl ester carboxylesterase